MSNRPKKGTAPLPPLDRSSIKSVQQYIQQYKKSRQDRKETLGGEGYLEHLQIMLQALQAEKDTQRTVVPPENTGESGNSGSRNPEEMDIDTEHDDGVDPLTDDRNDIERFLDGLGLTQVNRFLTAFSKNGGQYGNPGPNDAELLATWTRIQTTARKFSNSQEGVPFSSVSWPLPNSPTAVQRPDIEATYRWFSHCLQPAEELDDGAPETSGRKKKDVIATIYDYETRKMTNVTRAMVLEARMNPAAWPGFIEGGVETAKVVFNNRSSNAKCLTCTLSGRGTSAPKSGKTERGEGPGFLTCKCPESTALTELWMVKATAANAGTAALLNSQKIKDVKFNPVNLRVVEAAISLVSGLTPETLFRPEESRLKTTIQWALARLASHHVSDPSEKKKIDDVRRLFEETAMRG
ncbi:hypothetical protein PLICRDRAFT_54292 [Plicaturopsis crispa FD-325 SS-3]|nr:hypothetical protein PLICRDRAFT_54292 [Plicaturopsis crispa FD-325 SS-3]